MLEVDFNCAFLQILAHDVPSKSNSDGFLELDLSTKYIFLNANVIVAMMAIRRFQDYFIFQVISRIKVFTTQQLNLCRRDTRYGYFEFAKKIVKNNKTTHFLNENVFVGYPRRRDMGLPSKV